MQEQNFEKQVKEKMEELSVLPSAPVWMKVEEKIRQKRSKRRIFFWIFPLGILLAGLITYSLVRNGSHPTALQNSDPRQKDFSTQKTNTNEGEWKTLEKPATERQTNSNAAETENRNSIAQETIKTKSLKAGHKIISTAKANKISPVKKNIYTVPGREIATTKNLSAEKSATKDEVTVAENNNTALSNTSVSELNPPLLSASINEPGDSVIVKTKEEIPDSITENKTAPIKFTPVKYKWIVAPYFSAGASSVQYANGSMDKSANRLNMAPATPGLGSALPPPQAASDPANGFALHMGVKFMKPVNKRLSIYAGTGYHYASTHLQVGNTVRRDTVFTNFFTSNVSVDQYYNSGRSTDYLNRYHFIEIPLGINWRVNKKFPLELETGVSLSQLIASNALTYDGTGSYYRNKKLLYKTHFTFNTSLSYRLFTIKEKTFHAGPYLQYHLTQMEKNNSRQHLLSAGVGLSMKF